MPMYKVSPDVQPRNQPTSACCWLTCLEMLFEWKKKDTSQILSTMDKSPNLFPYYMRDNGIAPGECKETAKALGLRWAGDGEIDAQVLETALKAHGPYWVAGMWMKNFSHVIVVTGVNVITQEIKYINPWQNFDLSESSGNMSWLNARGDIWKNCDGSLMYWL